MLKVTSAELSALKTEQLKVHDAKLSEWLETRDVGWSEYSEPERAQFLKENAERARAHDMLPENFRAMMAYAFLLSGDPKAFGERPDVISALSSERSAPAAKKRRLHAIAFDVRHGTNHATEKPKPDSTFALPDGKRMKKEGN